MHKINNSSSEKKHSRLQKKKRNMTILIYRASVSKIDFTEVIEHGCNILDSANKN